MAHSLGINHIQGHKISLKKFKSIEIISSIFSDHSGTKLEINHRKEEKSITWKLNNTLLKNQCQQGNQRGSFLKYLDK